MPTTARADFEENISRAEALLAHARPLPKGDDPPTGLRADLLRAAWMTAVGATDAYFCDAYAAVLSASLTAKRRQPDLVLPPGVTGVNVPLDLVLEPYERQNWRWRKIARRSVERASVLSLDAVKKLLNGFVRSDERFFSGPLRSWCRHPDAKIRQTGIAPPVFANLSEKRQRGAAKTAARVMDRRYGGHFQRRNECIHNCDRPKRRPRRITDGQVRQVIEDLVFLVRRSDEHLDAEFPRLLAECGCKPATLATLTI